MNKFAHWIVFRMGAWEWNLVEEWGDLADWSGELSIEPPSKERDEWLRDFRKCERKFRNSNRLFKLCLWFVRKVLRIEPFDFPY